MRQVPFRETSCQQAADHRTVEDISAAPSGLGLFFLTENLGLTGLLKNPFFAGLFMPGRGA